jgi:hypothetical protein
MKSEARIVVRASQAEWEALRKPCTHARTVVTVKDTSSPIPNATKSVTLPCATCGD